MNSVAPWRDARSSTLDGALPPFCLIVGSSDVDSFRFRSRPVSVHLRFAGPRSFGTLGAKMSAVHQSRGLPLSSHTLRHSVESLCLSACLSVCACAWLLSVNGD